MKKVLFIGVSKYDFKKSEPQHLKDKFLGLTKQIKPYILARGRPFCKKIWGAEFYLLPNRFFYWLVAFPMAIFVCLAKKIDTIVAQSPLMEGFLGAILKKLLKKELIVEIHGDWEARLPRFKKILNILAKFSLKNAHKIRAISAFTKQKAQKIAPHKPYFVFPTFTDIDCFLQETNTRFDHFILFVGNLQKIKGINHLIDAFSKISKEFPDFRLVLVGEGKEMTNLKRQAANLRIENKVEFKGELPQDATKNIMKNCYCLVLPSLTEGLGRVLMEAMALQKPVIGSNLGGIPDLIKDGHNGFLTKPADSDDLSKKLRILLANRNLASKMGQRGRRIVETRFSNQKYLENYLKMINIKS